MIAKGYDAGLPAPVPHFFMYDFSKQVPSTAAGHLSGCWNGDISTVFELDSNQLTVTIEFTFCDKEAYDNNRYLFEMHKTIQPSSVI